MDSNVFPPIHLRDPWAKAMCHQPITLFMSMILAIFICFYFLKTYYTMQILWCPPPKKCPHKASFSFMNLAVWCKVQGSPTFEFQRMTAALGMHQRCRQYHRPDLQAWVSHFRATWSQPSHLNILGSFVSKGKGRGCYPNIWGFLHNTRKTRTNKTNKK